MGTSGRWYGIRNSCLRRNGLSGWRGLLGHGPEPAGAPVDARVIGVVARDRPARWCCGWGSGKVA
jgi:hypothetical protein